MWNNWHQRQQMTRPVPFRPFVFIQLMHYSLQSVYLTHILSFWTVDAHTSAASPADVWPVSMWPKRLVAKMTESRISLTQLKVSTFVCWVDVSLLFNVYWSSVRRSPLLAVSEVTVRSITAVPVAFALAVLGVKRAVNATKVAGGP